MKSRDCQMFSFATERYIVEIGKMLREKPDYQVEAIREAMHNERFIGEGATLLKTDVLNPSMVGAVIDENGRIPCGEEIEMCVSMIGRWLRVCKKTFVTGLAIDLYDAVQANWNAVEQQKNSECVLAGRALK